MDISRSSTIEGFRMQRLSAKIALVSAFIIGNSAFAQDRIYKEGYMLDGIRQTGILRDDASIRSPNGKYSLIMQRDGSLVMYRSDGSVRYRMAKHGSYAILQWDGNFVEYDQSGKVLWNTETGGKCCPSYLQIYDSGNLALRGPWPNVFPTYTFWSIGDDPFPGVPPGTPAKRFPTTSVAPPGPPPSAAPYVTFPSTAN